MVENKFLGKKAKSWRNHWELNSYVPSFNSFHFNTCSAGQKQPSFFNLFTGPQKELFFPSMKFLSSKKAETKIAIKTFVDRKWPKTTKVNVIFKNVIFKNKTCIFHLQFSPSDRWALEHLDTTRLQLTYGKNQPLHSSLCSQLLTHRSNSTLLLDSLWKLNEFSSQLMRAKLVV